MEQIDPPEIWRSYIGDYLVSTKGRIRHIDSIKPRTLQISPNGYRTWTFMLGGKQHNRPVHRAVLEAFVGPRPSPTHVARHLNGDPLDNRLENLAWGTPIENAADKIRHGTIRRGEANTSAKLTEELVRQIRASSEPGIVWARRLGVSNRCISSVRNRSSWSWLEEESLA